MKIKKSRQIIKQHILTNFCKRLMSQIRNVYHLIFSVILQACIKYPHVASYCRWSIYEEASLHTRNRMLELKKTKRTACSLSGKTC